MSKHDRETIYIDGFKFETDFKTKTQSAKP